MTLPTENSTDSLNPYQPSGLPSEMNGTLEEEIRWTYFTVRKSFSSEALIVLRPRKNEEASRYFSIAVQDSSRLFDVLQFHPLASKARVTELGQELAESLELRFEDWSRIRR